MLFCIQSDVAQVSPFALQQLPDKLAIVYYEDFTQTKLYKKIKAIIVRELGVDEDEVTPAASFADLDANSSDITDLMVVMSKEFSLAIPPADIPGLTTVGKMYSYIREALIKQKGTPAKTSN